MYTYITDTIQVLIKNIILKSCSNNNVLLINSNINIQGVPKRINTV